MSDQAKYHARLNIIGPTGLENQVRRVLKTEIKDGSGGYYLNDIVYISHYPLYNAYTVITQYDFMAAEEVPKFFRCVNINAGFNTTKPTDYLSLPNSSCWNKFVHRDHKMQLQVWKGETKVDSITLGPTISLERKTVPKKIGNFSSELDIFVVPQNPYGILGVGHQAKNNVFRIIELHIDEQKIDMYEERQQHV